MHQICMIDSPAPPSLSLISTKVSFFAIQEINNNGAQELTLSNLNDLVTSFKKSQLVKVGTLIVIKGEGRGGVGWGRVGKRLGAVSSSLF
jgi:hypothetical protein